MASAMTAITEFLRRKTASWYRGLRKSKKELFCVGCADMLMDGRKEVAVDVDGAVKVPALHVIVSCSK